MNLVTVNCSFKHHNMTSTKGTKKNAGIERSKKKTRNKKQEQTSNRKEKRKKKKQEM